MLLKWWKTIIIYLNPFPYIPPPRIRQELPFCDAQMTEELFGENNYALASSSWARWWNTYANIKHFQEESKEMQQADLPFWGNSRKLLPQSFSEHKLSLQLFL